MTDSIIVTDSITRLSDEAAGAVAYCASHGGHYCALLARAAGLRAVVLSDAGVGRAQAGIAALVTLQHVGVAAATISHRSARIGDGRDGYDRGVISYANALAEALGLAAGMSCKDALALLDERAPDVTIDRDAAADEHRSTQPLDGGGHVVIADSVSLVRPGDAGQVVVCGSHGGLLGGDPRTAVSADVRAIVYNDADRGADDAGLSRLPALDERGIAAACVSAWTAPIGDGLATYRDGIISAVNATARRLGADVGISAKEFAAIFVQRSV